MLKPKRKVNGGFTLIELMITVVIIGVLSAIAIPSYRDYIRRGKISDGVGGLSTLKIRAEQYFGDKRSYSGFCNTNSYNGVAGISKYFTYTCVDAATTYNLTITGNNSESMAGYIYTVNESNVRSSNINGVAYACWAKKIGDVC